MSASKSKLNSEKLGLANVNGVLAPVKAANGKNVVTAVAAGKAGPHSVNIVLKEVQGFVHNKWHHQTRMVKPNSANSSSAVSKTKDTEAAPPAKQSAPRLQVLLPSAASAYACTLPNLCGSSVSFSTPPHGPSPFLPSYWGTAKLAVNDTGNALFPGTKSSITFNNIPLCSTAWQPRHANASNSDGWSVSAALTVPRAVSPAILIKPFTVPAWLGAWAPKQVVSQNDSVVLAANNKSVRLTASAVRGPATISHAPADTPSAQALSAKYAKTHISMLGGVSYLLTAPVPARGDTSTQPSALRQLLTSHEPILAPKVIASGTVNAKTELSVGARRACKRLMAAVGLAPAAPQGGEGKDASKGKRTLEATAKATLPLLSAAPPTKGAGASRPEQVAAADLMLYCGALFPLMLAAKGSLAASLPPPPPCARGTIPQPSAVKPAHSPLRSVQCAATGTQGFGGELKSAWTLAAALDCGWGGTLGWSVDSKQPGASIGWKLTSSLFPQSQQRGGSGAVGGAKAANSQKKKLSAMQQKHCEAFRRALRMPVEGAGSAAAHPCTLPSKSTYAFPGRVGTVKATHSGPASNASVSMNVAAALQPWKKLRSGPLGESVRSVTAALSLSLKHSPVHSVRQGGTMTHMEQ